MKKSLLYLCLVAFVMCGMNSPIFAKDSSGKTAVTKVEKKAEPTKVAPVKKSAHTKAVKKGKGKGKHKGKKAKK